MIDGIYLEPLLFSSKSPAFAEADFLPMLVAYVSIVRGKFGSNEV
jgi:hypothetical protein